MSHITITITIALALAMSTSARAQVPPPYAYQPTQDERTLLARGEISEGATTGGGVAAMFFGLGIGQAIQGRWLERGWIFTVGDLGATALLVAGTNIVFSRDCGHACMERGEALFLGGGLVALGLRIWQTADAFVVPARHNARVRELRRRIAATGTGIALTF